MSRQRPCVYASRRGRTRPIDYLLYEPPQCGQEPGKQWPCILFLHGAGERGSDVELVKRQGVPRLIEEQGDFPFITISPQCPSGSFWHSRLATLKRLVEDVASRCPVDRSRIYLTGISMGGYGTWHLAAKYPDLFAAIVPICGGGLPSQGFPERVCAIKDVPVWAFHGADDPVVPIEDSLRVVEALRACGGKIELTIYSGVGHDCWTRTYQNPRVFRWLLEQKRPE